MTTEYMDLAEKILDQIDRHPETHNQANWGFSSDCGSTACVAGWAGLISGDADYDALGNLILLGSDGSSRDWLTYGQHKLGLSRVDLSTLFSSETNEQAKEALKYIAKGETIPWVDIIG